MAYRRVKTGSNSYTTYNTKTGVNTHSSSMGNKNLRITQTSRSDGKMYTTTTSNVGGWVTRERKSYNTTVKTPKTKQYSPRRSRGVRYKSMSFKYTPQLFLICIILIAFGFVLEKLGF